MGPNAPILSGSLLLWARPCGGQRHPLAGPVSPLSPGETHQLPIATRWQLRGSREDERPRAQQVGGRNQPGTRLRVQPCPLLRPRTLSGWSLTFILSPPLPVAPRSLETPPPPSRRAHCSFPALRKPQMAVQGSPRHECQLGTTVSCSGRLGPRPLDWWGPGRGEQSPPPRSKWDSPQPTRTVPGPLWVP